MRNTSPLEQQNQADERAFGAPFGLKPTSSPCCLDILVGIHCRCLKRGFNGHVPYYSGGMKRTRFMRDGQVVLFTFTAYRDKPEHISEVVAFCEERGLEVTLDRLGSVPVRSFWLPEKCTIICVSKPGTFL